MKILQCFDVLLEILSFLDYNNILNILKIKSKKNDIIYILKYIILNKPFLKTIVLFDYNDYNLLGIHYKSINTIVINRHNFKGQYYLHYFDNIIIKDSDIDITNLLHNDLKSLIIQNSNIKQIDFNKCKNLNKLIINNISYKINLINTNCLNNLDISKDKTITNIII